GGGRGAARRLRPRGRRDDGLDGAVDDARILLFRSPRQGRRSARSGRYAGGGAFPYAPRGSRAAGTRPRRHTMIGPIATAPAAPATEPTRRRLLSYGVGSVGTGIFSTVPGLLLLYYMTDTLAVPAGVAGLVVTLPKAWDAFFNPYVGAASDREAVRSGRRSRLLLAGAISLPPAF